MTAIRMALAGMLVWAGAVLSFPLFMPAAALEARMAADLQELRHMFGSWAPDRVRRFAAKLNPQEAGRESTPIAPPSRPLVAGAAKFHPGSAAAEIAMALQDRWRRGLNRQCELAAVRLGIVLVWLVALWPLLVAAACDGWMQARVRQARAALARPAAFTLAGLAMVGLASVPVMFVTLPLPWPAGWAPGWALATGLVLAIRMALGRPRLLR